MDIIIESHIPFARGVAEAAGHTVRYLPPGEITPAAVSRADALVVRTRTHCDKTLLDGSRVRYIATATIGTDHIDLDYCRLHGIRVDNAPGCNAPAVAQYVLSVIGRLRPGGIKCLGIIGVGHVGTVVDRWARVNGIRTMLCDPPRAAAEGLDGFHTLGQIAAACDAITLHVPLDDTTRHMVDHRLLQSIAPGTLLVNAARGAVCDTGAMLRNPHIDYAIDCWEDEPDISRHLLHRAVIATPHIAGYSLEGKRRATAMVLRAIDPTIDTPLDPVAQAPALTSIVASYDPMADTLALRHDPTAFETLRNTYNLRHEPQ